MQVEFDVFSGRPNPTWKLSSSESAEILALLDNLPPAPVPAENIALGYRGFLLSDLQQNEQEIVQIRICAGVVTVYGQTSRYYQDLHQAERHLLQQAAQRGFEAVVKGVLAQQNEHDRCRG